MRLPVDEKLVEDEVRSLVYRLRSYRLLRNLLIGFILVALVNVLFTSLFYTPKMYRIVEKNRDLVLRYEMLQNRIRAAQHRLDEIKHRDNYVYRPLFSSDTISIDGIYAPYDRAKYAGIEGDEYAPLMMSAWLELDQLARSLYLESRSLDDLQVLARDKEKFSTAIPAVWPIDRTKLRNKIGAFGYRMHPLYHRWKFHSGVDLPGHVGDPVYATGDGVVIETERSRSRAGYGTQILLDHGFGYRTRYAHLNKLLVERGDSVKRGQIIGELGNTGASTAPHLHYEVLYMRSFVNPVNYFDKNMSAEAYKSLMNQIQDANYEAD
ncbi:MAG: M23 family metallopeptidase [Alistipes sp.]|nr:M23 family metallopeptidase [Alistipes sp.]